MQTIEIAFAWMLKPTAALDLAQQDTHNLSKQWINRCMYSCDIRYTKQADFQVCSFDNGPVDGEYEVGQSVTVRNDDHQWDRTAHIVKRVIYRPVAIVLDNDNNLPIPIEEVRPYPDRWPTDANVNGYPRLPLREISIDPALMAKLEE